MQRVERARVTALGRVTGEIARGLCVFAGVTHRDRETDADWLARRVAGLRVFAEGDQPMHLDVRAAGVHRDVPVADVIDQPVRVEQAAGAERVRDAGVRESPRRLGERLERRVWRSRAHSRTMSTPV